MPSFFSKLFRRKSSSPVDDGGIATKLKGKKTKVPKKDKAALKKERLHADAFNRGSKGSTLMVVGDGVVGQRSDRAIQLPASKSESPTNRDSKNGSSSSNSGALSPRNVNATDSHSPTKQVRERDRAPLPSSPGDDVDAGGFANFCIENREKDSIAPLSHSRLQQFERQQARESVKTPNPYASAFGEEKTKPTSRLSDGQLVSKDNLAPCFPGPTSDFTLSTEGEDEDYNQMREKVLNSKPHQNKPATTVSLSTEYSAHDDAQSPKIASNASPRTTNVNEADNTASGSSPRFTFESEVEDALVSKNKGKADARKRSPSPDPRSIKTHLKKQVDEDANKETLSKVNVEKGHSEKHSLSPRTIAVLQGQKHKSAVPLPSDKYPGSTDSEYASPENNQSAALLHSPKKELFPSIGVAAASGGENTSRFEIGDFADFDSAGFPTLKNGESDPFNISHTEKISSFKSHSFSINTNTDSLELFDPRLTSKSVANSTSPISDLLAQAKERRNRRLQGASASSVNSAPVITAAYLRQHHKLDSSKSAVNDSGIRYPVTFRSVSSGGRAETSDALSANSGGASSAAMAAKEKLREKRKDKDGLISGGTGPVSPKPSTTLRKNRSRSSRAGPEDDDSDKGDNSEDWLIDEVTGALGPRGIAADLESLSERSNRSSLSHRSHRSLRSNKASSRLPKSSNESTDSRQSRTSRYSTRSPRSTLSHMSEQSRSVANDLLRLEMQLAMVGSQGGLDGVKGGDAAGGADGKSVGSSSLGVTSFTSRTSRTSRYTAASRASATMTKRTKLTVVAPPGKLGIILANKTDAKGTVVSGVRTSSVLSGKISPGDRIIAIDGEDVSRMTVSEITTIMARNNEFDRELTVLSTPKQQRDATTGADVIWGQLSAGPRPNSVYSRHSAPDVDLPMTEEGSIGRLVREENSR